MTPEDFADRFWPKVDQSGEYWLWTAACNSDGYGRFWLGNRNTRAHRAGWILQRGPIPDDLTIDHLCRNRRCVRADHLEVVTQGENARRGDGIEAAAAAKRAKTHCRNGHEFTPESTYRAPGRPGWRQCRTCRALLWQRSAAAQRQVLGQDGE